MNTVSDLFQESIDRYAHIIEKTDTLTTIMSDLSAEEILKQCDELQKLQQQQAVIDNFIIDVMNDTGPEILNTKNIGEYQRILDKAMLACNTIASKTEAIRSLLNSEIQKLKKESGDTIP